MIFRQLFDRESCTYTYLLGEEASGECVLVDSVIDHVERDVRIIEELGLTLKYTLETHVHADHITGSGTLRQRLGSEVVMCVTGGAPTADILVDDGRTLRFGDERIVVRTTPGHTSTCVSYHLPDHRMLFTGDALFIRGCGRTDFQSGDSVTLYRSIHDKVFTLPADTRIFPGHDYKGHTESTVAEEREHNPRLGGGRSVDEFVKIMADLKLSRPAKIHIALPANQNCGLPVAASSESGAAQAALDSSGSSTEVL